MKVVRFRFVVLFSMFVSNPPGGIVGTFLSLFMSSDAFDYAITGRWTGKGEESMAVLFISYGAKIPVRDDTPITAEAFIHTPGVVGRRGRIIW